MKKIGIGLLMGISLLIYAGAAEGNLQTGVENTAPDAMMSSWAAQAVWEAYQNGWVSPAFDLGGDYTQAITRGQFARLAVDFLAAERGETVEQLIENYGILLVEPPAPQEETIPEEQEGPSTGEDALVEQDGLPDEDGSVAAPTEHEEGVSQNDPLDGGLPYVMGGSFHDTSSVYIELAARMGIVQGAEGQFRPNAQISRAEAASMLRRCLGVLGITEANVQPQLFDDAYKIPRWAVEAVKFVSGRTDAAGKPVMGGANGRFAPDAAYSIEQAILTLGRMHQTLTVDGVYENWREVPDYDRVSLALTFGGDCTFGRGRDFPYRGSFDEMYDKKGKNYFFSGIPAFFDDDLTMVNFEGTLTNAKRYARKKFVFKGRPEYADILTAGSIDVVTVANNHSMDYLQKGFEDTLAHLSSRVAVSGYARMPIIEVKGVRIGFVSNVGWSFDAAQKRFIKNAVASLRKAGADIVIFNYHWGIEGRYKSNATQREIGRYCIDQGADLVIGHHPHVVQEVEVYRGKPIAYSLGNLVFGGNHNPREKSCLIFRQHFTFDLGTRKVVDSSYKALPYRVSSVNYRNDYHPVEKK